MKWSSLVTDTLPRVALISRYNKLKTSCRGGLPADAKASAFAGGRNGNP